MATPRTSADGHRGTLAMAQLVKNKQKYNRTVPNLGIYFEPKQRKSSRSKTYEYHK